MKSFIVFALLVAAAAAAPAGPEADAVILKQDNDNIGLGQYQSGYETSNGIAANEQGTLKNAGTENEALEVVGRFSYPGPDGVIYTVEYVANENGFTAQGSHLPVAPQA